MKTQITLGSILIALFISGYYLGLRTGKAEGQLIQIEKKVEVMKNNYYPDAK